jgi:predicted HTH domain antitoxin
VNRQATVEVPDESLEVLGEDAAKFGREMLVVAVLRWFEEGRLSQGQSAEMLGLKRGAFLDLLYEHRISPVQISVEDLEKDALRG